MRGWNYDQKEIPCLDEENQNDNNYSETVSSELHTTILSESQIKVKLDLWNLSKDIWCYTYIGLNYMSKLNVGWLQNNQHHFICFSRAVGAVVNCI